MCRWNNLIKCKPGCYAIDARQEVTLLRNDQDHVADYDEFGESEYEDDTDRADTERDEREVNIKREKITNRWVSLQLKTLKSIYFYKKQKQAQLFRWVKNMKTQFQSHF